MGNKERRRKHIKDNREKKRLDRIPIKPKIHRASKA